MLEKARAQAEERNRQPARRRWTSVRRALTRARQPLEALKPVQEQVEEIAADGPAGRARASRVRWQSAEKRRPLRPGDKVHVRSIQMEGVITAVGESDVEVQVGNLRVRARLARSAAARRLTRRRRPPKSRAARQAPPSPLPQRRRSKRGHTLLPFAGDGDRPARAARRRRPGRPGALPRIGLPGRAALRAHHPRQRHRAGCAR